ncbi:hypothetical protein Dsin_014288 [Dipteronia sinensis]|uniref:Uncharacterized protein n=1 Tax=Dipteronia sinensis TaxID=43782 RepID=A0AAE0ALL8_9ROSI|nr:hypothetical protein Dsin_014288 [Dipteronia sinensis]
MDEQQQIVSPIVKILLGKLRSLHKQNIPLGHLCVDTIELKKLEKLLRSFTAVLLDAEKQQLHNNNVRRCLKKLKDVCYDAEDALEELEMEQSRNITGKVCDFISSSKSPASLKIKKIRERLDAIKIFVSKFCFEVRVHGDNGNVHREREIITHSSFVVASHDDVFERDRDKEDIIEKLEQNNDLDVIHILGPRGIGKTTLAKLVYNDKRIDKIFNIKMWVSYPHKFFEKEIIIDIIYSITGRMENNMEIDRLQEVLRAILKGKKYLLVLDELSLNSIKDWTKLKSLLSVGAKYSKIILSATNQEFLSSEKTNLTYLKYLIDRLSNESNLDLFMGYAFREGKEKNPSLRKIGEEIATKCAGNPLVVKILGSILYFSTDEDDWKYVRDNIKQLGVETETETLSILKLGYDLLPFDLKQCLICCSVFPKDHCFNNITLIQFWMAHGLLQSDDDEEPESIGMRYINGLRRRCLFQDFEQNFDFISFKMHHLVHDLATETAPDDCLIIGSSKAYYPRKAYRHISVVDANLLQEQLFGNRRTRSILFFEMIRPSQSLIGSCISQHPNLRVLDFRNSDMDELPEGIDKLKHLRYLNLTKNTRIKRLPKSIFMLSSLETLLLGGCKLLEELPRDIRLLVNLRMLVFSSKQRCLPKNGIGCLTSLRCLGIVSCYNLEYLFQDIGCLQALRTLIIGDCPKLVSLPSGVKDLSSLEKLMLSNSKRSKKSTKCNLEMEMELQSIKPHLRMLCIDGLPELKEWPQWLLQCSCQHFTVVGY